MPRPILFLIILLLLLGGALFLLAGQAENVPTETIEIEVNTPADAG